MGIKKLLIANRGEIAVRVILAAREMGIRSVAIFSEADRHAIHPQLADEAIFLDGPTLPNGDQGSYLDADRILEIAAQRSADAIHPGYGFLSERAAFSEACAAQGIRFVGPPANAMRQLGSKRDAKELATRAGVPLVPGYFQPHANDEDLVAAAREIGYPVMLKASAGGGGRGMRPAYEEAEMRDLLPVARQEALQGFGDDEMIVEKLILDPRHVEIQVLADQHGNALSLYERECSIQRRRQKLIEESPSPVLSPATRAAMEDASLRLVQASGYQNAGTVEFILDEKSGEFYFLEVNARLQVEHPVTESVTGLDLVQWQIAIASGETLGIAKPPQKGHAMELRILAEDPAKGFLPSVGKILAWAEPKAPGVRVDTGFAAGSVVSPFFDSLLAKLIVRAESRDACIRRVDAALRDFHVLGVSTNIAFLLDVIRHPDFQVGAFDTGWLERALPKWSPTAEPPMEIGVVAAMAGGLAPALAGSSKQSWAASDGFRNVRG